MKPFISLLLLLLPAMGLPAQDDPLAFEKGKTIYLDLKNRGFPSGDSIEKKWTIAIEWFLSGRKDSSAHYLAASYFERGFLEYVRSAYPDAVKTTQAGLAIAENAGLKEWTIKLNYQLGNIYSKIGSAISGLDTEKNRAQYLGLANHFLHESLKISQQEKDTTLAIQAMAGIANFYIGLPDYDSADILLRQILKEAKADNHKVRGSAFNNLGIISFEKKDYTQAEKYFLEAIHEAGLLEKSLVLQSALGNLANVYVKQKRYAEAARALHQLSPISRQSNRKQALSKNYFTLAEMYKAEGRPDSALFYTEKYYASRDSILNESHSASLQELTAKYEKEQNERQINSLLVANLEKETRIQKKNLLFTLAGAITVLSLLLIWFHYRKKSLDQKKIAAEMKQQLLAAQMNPHFLFNALNSIQRLYVDGRIDEGNQFMSDFARFVREVLDKTGRTRIPLYEELEFLQTYLTLEKKRLGDKFDYQIRIPENLRHSLAEVPSLISQPLAENALVHGILPQNEKGFIDIEVKQEQEGMLSFTVRDNGVGFDSNHNEKKESGHRSKGIELIRSRLGKKGQLIIESIRNQPGTIAILHIPI